MILGIESTAHTFGIGVYDGEKVIANVKDMYRPKEGGIIPIEAAKHHEKVKNEIYEKALEEANVKESEIEYIAYSQGPGLPPCLKVGLEFAKELGKKLNVKLIPVNHCIAHIEIAKYSTPCEDPVVLYVSGGNTQVIGLKNKRYRIFGETLDIAVGNLLDSFGRELNLPFPAGPVIEKLATKGSNYIKLPYSVKGMDVSFSGILTYLKKIKNEYSKEDLSFSLQETVFSMLLEVSERALSHLKKNELIIVGGVASNERLRKMAKIMMEERNGKFYEIPKKFAMDNGAMIAYTGYLSKNYAIPYEKADFKQKFRTDEVLVYWAIEKEKEESLPSNIIARGAEAILYKENGMLIKERIKKGYRIKEIDEELRKKRTKSESNLIIKARRNRVNVPLIYKVSDYKIMMEYLNGENVKEILEKLSEEERKEIYEKIGGEVAKLHEANIIHNDLTTGNMIYYNNKIYLIDFGLSFSSKRIEDKAVDLHLLKQAIISKHFSIANEAIKNIFESYKRNYDEGEKVIDKIAEIESRGRYKKRN